MLEEPIQVYRERPIIFQTWGVEAILDDIKHHTRRLNGLKEINEEPDRYELDFFKTDPNKNRWAFFEEEENETWNTKKFRYVKCPYGVPGDYLWVKETWRLWESASFSSTGEPLDPDIYLGPIPKQRGIRSVEYKEESATKEGPWRPSLFMPKWASRIKLRIEELRLERLQDISEEDAKEEGIKLPVNQDGVPLLRVSSNRPPKDWTFREYFFEKWDEINKKSYTCDWNPWVWVVVFRHILT